jgi:hypothetical protein
MPCFAAWADSTFFVASKATARKSRNLEKNGHCVLTKDADDVHFIIEAEAKRVMEHDRLVRAWAAFDSGLRLAHPPGGRRARCRLRGAYVGRPTISRVRNHAHGGVRVPDRWGRLRAHPLALQPLRPGSNPLATNDAANSLEVTAEC